MSRLMTRKGAADTRRWPATRKKTALLQIQNNHLMFTDRAYAVGKRLVQVIIPAASAAYYSLAGIWNFPAAGQVTGTAAVICTFLGISLGLSSKSYDKSGIGDGGDLVVTTHPDGSQKTTIDLTRDPVKMVGQKQVSFKVKHRPLKAEGHEPPDAA